MNLGPLVRLDVQGLESLANYVKKKRSPLVVAYRAVEDTMPGFRYNTTGLFVNSSELFLHMYM